MTNAERLNDLMDFLEYRKISLLQEMMDLVTVIQDDMATDSRQYTELGRNTPEYEISLCVDLTVDSQESWIRTDGYHSQTPEYMVSGTITPKTVPVRLLNRLIATMIRDAMADQDSDTEAA